MSTSRLLVDVAVSLSLVSVYLFGPSPTTLRRLGNGIAESFSIWSSYPGVVLGRFMGRRYEEKLCFQEAARYGASMIQPVSPIHELTVTAASEDVDELGHVSNLVYVRWVLEAAKSHSAAVGWGYDAYQRLGAWFVVQRHEIDYRRPAMGGDEIRLATWIESWTAASSLRRTSIRRVSDDVELAAAVTTWALVTVAGGRPTRIPAGMKADFQ